MRLALAENLLLGWLLGRVRSGAQLEMQVMPFAKAGMVLSAPRNFVVVASSDTAAEADLAANMDGRVLKFVDDIHYEKEQLIQQLRRFSAPCTHCFGGAIEQVLVHVTARWSGYGDYRLSTFPLCQRSIPQ
jgi:hypothetical protein